MADDIATKREELELVYDNSDKLEHGRGDFEMVTRYRARARRLVDQIGALKAARDV